MELSDTAKKVLQEGEIKVRVRRSGVYQQMTFKTKTARFGTIEYNELFTDRVIELTELVKISNEIGLPIEAPNGKAFPEGTSAPDFQVSAPNDPSAPA